MLTAGMLPVDRSPRAETAVPYRRPNPIIAVWHRTLEELIEHNGAVEVVAVSMKPDDPTPPLRQRVRPFELDRLADDESTDTLVLERPRPTNQHPKPTPVRSRLDIYLYTEQLRLVAPYEVQEVLNYQLNERQRLTVLKLRRVSDIVSAQRRAYFRVDTSAVGFGRVTLNAPGKDGLEAKPVVGHMVNLSAGGVGIMADVPSDQLPDFGDADFDFLVPLPDGGPTIRVAARVRRVQPERQQRTYLGLEFQLDEKDPRDLRVAETLGRITTELQREQLRKRRTA